MRPDLGFRLLHYLTLALAGACLIVAEGPFLPDFHLALAPFLVLVALAFLLDGRWVLPAWGQPAGPGHRRRVGVVGGAAAARGRLLGRAGVAAGRRRAPPGPGRPGAAAGQAVPPAQRPRLLALAGDGPDAGRAGLRAGLRPGVRGAAAGLPVQRPGLPGRL